MLTKKQNLTREILTVILLLAAVAAVLPDMVVTVEHSPVETVSPVEVAADRIPVVIELSLVLAAHLRPMAAVVAAAGTAEELEMATPVAVAVLLTYPGSLAALRVPQDIYSAIPR